MSTQPTDSMTITAGTSPALEISPAVEKEMRKKRYLVEQVRAVWEEGRDEV